MPLRYLSNAKELIREICRGELKQQAKGFVRTVNVGNFCAYCVCGLPIVLKQYNPNFKLKFHVGSIPLLSVSRTVPARADVLKEKTNRRTRIYFSIGSLPYADNGSGIPRVAKELSAQGLKRSDVDCLPVYPDPVSGKYRVAMAWLRNRHEVTRCELDAREDGVDPEISVMSGDWLIHSMINANEIDYMAAYFREFRRIGGKVGFILHDLIPEDYPQFYKNRDVKLYRRWLARLHESDGIFAISKATLDSYCQWANRNGIKVGNIGTFHLGANFKKPNSTSNVVLPKELLSHPFFLQVSTIEPRKGYQQLLDAFDELWQSGCNVNLAIVGRAGWKVRSLCKRISSHPELGRRLFWFNRAPDDVLYCLYQKSRAVVVASEAEGFGLSVAEALFHGKDVIARDLAVFREIAGDSAVYFEGKDARHLAEAIHNVMISSPNTNSPIPPLRWEESFNQLLMLIQEFSDDRN